MKKIYMSILILMCNLSIYGCTSPDKIIVKSGIFSCVIDESTLYFENSSNDEHPLYNLKFLEFSGKINQVASNLSSINLMKLKNSVVAYTDGYEVVSYNLKNKKKWCFLKADKGYKIIGFQSNSKCDSILLVQINYTRNTALVKVIKTGSKETVFKREIRLNTNELEGISPRIYWVNNSFVFSLQDKLYAVVLRKTQEIKMICSGCDGYAISGKEVLYYKFMSDEMTNAYFLDTKTWESINGDQSLNSKIYKCAASQLFTSIQKGVYVPYYIICGIPYLFNGGKWSKVRNVVIYEDTNVRIELLINKNNITGSKGFTCSFFSAIYIKQRSTTAIKLE